MVTITFDIGQVLTWSIIGVFVGFLANVLVRGRGMGLLGNLIIGLIGAFVGIFLFAALGINIPFLEGQQIIIKLADVFAAFIGALIVLFLITIIYRRRP
jgi:uncharacterized membrane protein YeaQ/YmgE (transglycosylase-associated protein family)